MKAKGWYTFLKHISQCGDTLVHIICFSNYVTCDRILNTPFWELSLRVELQYVGADMTLP